MIPDSRFIMPGIRCEGGFVGEHDRVTNICLNYINWQATQDNNVHVINSTNDLYRYADTTCQVAFLFECIKDTVDTFLSEEVFYLKDRMRSGSMYTIDSICFRKV